jgi:hypothetical protein
MTLTIEAIRVTEDNEELVHLFIAELRRLLPDSVREDREHFQQTLDSFPRGLRAMAGMEEFDLSMALDGLAWHFENHHDERDFEETLNGLREFELPEIAEMFAQMCEFMKPHLATLQSGDFGGKKFSDWFEDIGAEDFAHDKDLYIWDYCDKLGKLGMLETWPKYARKYPEQCVAAEALL